MYLNLFCFIPQLSGEIQMSLIMEAQKYRKSMSESIFKIPRTWLWLVLEKMFMLNKDILLWMLVMLTNICGKATKTVL